MTQQAREVLIFRNQKLYIDESFGVPKHDRILLTGDSSFYNSACWRAYVGTWEINEDKLFLVSIKGKYKLLGNPPLFADWYSGTIKIPYVEPFCDCCTNYSLRGCSLVSIKEGKIVSIDSEDGILQKEYNNRPSFKWGKRYAEVYPTRFFADKKQKFTPISTMEMLLQLIKAYSGEGYFGKIPSAVVSIFTESLNNKMLSEDDFQGYIYNHESEIEDAYDHYVMPAPRHFDFESLPVGLSVHFRKYRKANLIEQKIETLRTPYFIRMFKKPIYEHHCSQDGFDGCKQAYSPLSCTWDELQDYKYDSAYTFGVRTLHNGDICQFWFNDDEYDLVIGRKEVPLFKHLEESSF
ncbi:hypothetical protein RI844_20180 [Thalassotalea fonticola]|uniref:Uncharacterized protein n=1 Tax=Thalassotalea fonticola TaxID=3065649 RepID=A0ABZ0GP13_9GAMM|nr:hypothetical protein RI844_20180 [Colwelliaceae bacterium S1-1]